MLLLCYYLVLGMAARNSKIDAYSVGFNCGSGSSRVAKAAFSVLLSALCQLPSWAGPDIGPTNGLEATPSVVPGVVGGLPNMQVVAPAAVAAPAPRLHAEAKSSPAAPNKVDKILDTRPPFPIASKFSRTVQTVTGVNLATSMVAQVVASKVVQKKLGGHCKVKVRLYSFTDLLAGKVKTVTIQGKGCSLKQVPLGTVVATSSPFCFDWRKHNGKVGGLNTPLRLDLVGELKQEDVCKALSTQAVANSLRGLKIDLPGLGEQQLQILKPKVSLGDKRITIDALLITKDANPDTGVNLTISAVPLLQGSKIVLTETRVSCPDILDPENFAKFTQDLFNPLVDFGKYDRSDHAFRMEGFVVERDKVTGSGNLLLVPRSVLAGRTAGSGQPVK